MVGEEKLVEVPEIFNEDASNFRAQSFESDDDNEPAPENCPTREVTLYVFVFIFLKLEGK